MILSDTIFKSSPKFPRTPPLEFDNFILDLSIDLRPFIKTPLSSLNPLTDCFTSTTLGFPEFYCFVDVGATITR